MVKKFHIVVFLLLHLLAGTAWGEIEKLRTLEVKGYFRVTGGPAGAFYFLKKGSYEVNQSATNESFIRRLRGSQKLQTTEQGKHYAVISYKSFRPTELEVTGIRLYTHVGNSPTI